MGNNFDFMIINKVKQYINYSDDYFHKNGYKKLSPAGKFQASLLSVSIAIISIFENTPRNITDQISIATIINSLQNDFINLFNKHKMDFESKKYKLDSFHYMFDHNLVISNSYLMKNDYETWIIKATEIGIYSFCTELSNNKRLFKENQLSSEDYDINDYAFINLFTHPFISLINPEPKRKARFNSVKDSIEYNYEEIGIMKFKTLFISLIDDISNDIKSDKSFFNYITLTSVIDNSKNDTKSCYIATMAYEDINHPKVQNFRDFRDNYLSKTVLGNHFIKYYYKYSPSWIKVLEPHKTINKLIRLSLDILNYFIPKK